jgi:hypothetical protein
MSYLIERRAWPEQFNRRPVLMIARSPDRCADSHLV